MGDIVSFFKRARGLSLVERWNFHYRVTRENVAEHSFWVAFYALALLDLDDVDSVSYLRTRVLELALAHDLEEAVTGDCPALVKRDIKGSWQLVAQRGFNQVLASAPNDLKIRWSNRMRSDPHTDHAAERYVKAADLIDVIEYAQHELAHGNDAYFKIRKEAITLLARFKDLGSVQRVLDAYKYKGVDTPLPVEMTHL